MSPRRESGTGSIYQRASDGMWVTSIELPAEGTKRRRKVIARRLREDVVKAQREAKRDLLKTGDLPTASPTLSSWLDSWVERRARDKLKPRSADYYRGNIERYITPTIGRVRLDKLTPAHVQRLHDSITVDRGLSPTTALGAHRTLAKALKDAERAGKVTRNVATLVDAPTKAFAPMPSLTADEARTLLLSVADRPATAASWAVALLGGLRQGERLGLTRDAIDLHAGVITVSWQLQRLSFRHGCKVGGKVTCGLKRGGSCPHRAVHIPAGQEAQRIHGGLWLTRPKSQTGWREVPIAAPLAAVLEAYLAAVEPAESGLIFHRDNGTPVDPSDDGAAWDADLRAAGLPDVPLHSARHTCSTLLFKLGIDEQTRMKILGHSSAAVTRNYTHVADEQTRDAMVRLGGLLAPQIEG